MATIARFVIDRSTGVCIIVSNNTYNPATSGANAPVNSLFVSNGHMWIKNGTATTAWASII